jgi:hypothetical protein
MDLQNFDLSIDEEDGTFMVRARIEGAEATQSFRFPFAALELENLLLRIGTGQHGVWRRAGDAPELQAAKEFGGSLFEALFNGSVRDMFRRAQSDHAALRVRLSFSHAPALANLPWEFLYDREENLFLALSNTSPIVRYLEQPRRVDPLAVAAPLRLLVIIAAPVDLEALDADVEWANLQNALAPLVQRGSLHIERLTPPTFASLQAALRRTPYHLLHFIGHGAFEETVQDGVLFLEDERRHSKRTNGQSLGFLLRDYRATLRFVFLNVCEGGKTAVNDPFAGVAQSLIQQGIPAVLAMQSAVRDDYALTVARTFYATLTEQVSMETALTEARRTLFAETQRVEWGIPVLYSRTHEGLLFTLAHPPTPAVPAPVATAPSEAVKSTSTILHPTPPLRIEEPELEPEPESSFVPRTYVPESAPPEPAPSIPPKNTSLQPFGALLANNRQRWAIPIASVLAIILLVWLVQIYLSGNPIFASTPPSNNAGLATELVEAARSNHPIEEVTQALRTDGYLNEGSFWDVSRDLTGDDTGEWILQTAPDSEGCSNIIIVEPDSATLLHDSLANISAEATTTIRAISDITGDGNDDVLYQLKPCTANGSYQNSDYGLWSLVGNTQSSQDVLYLKLLQANALFDAQGYTEAKKLYDAIFSATTSGHTGWEFDAYEETNAIQKFAGARLIVASLIASGNDSGYLEAFRAAVDSNDPYQAPLNALVDSFTRDNDISAACAAFRSAIDNPDGLTYPLNEMGTVLLKADDVCPY